MEKKKKTGKRRASKKNKGKNIKKFLKTKKFGYIMAGIQAALMFVFLGLIIYLNVLPLKFLIPAVLVVLMFSGYPFLMNLSKKFMTAGKIYSGIVILIWIVGIYYVGHANGMFESISGANTKTDIINVYVLKEDTAKSLSDIDGYKVGILKVIDRVNTDKTIAKINDKVSDGVEITEFESWTGLINALYDGSADAIVLNSSYVNSITEMDGYRDFEDRTKVLFTNKIVTEIKVDTEVDVTSDAFVLYISGIDVEGDINITSRSDVNILAVINPTTRQILLLNTPRDYYVNIAIDGNPLDKLTHAGNYGVDVSMDTIGNLYGIDVNYYFRVNFTGFTKVVDALGGIEVNSDYEFTTSDGKYYIKKGSNFLNGAQALGFCRERYAFATGDNQRGKNQMAVIKAVINTMASSALLNDFSGLMDSLSGSFQTSMTSAQISALVRDQLSEGGSWNVVQYAVEGTGGKDYSYALGMNTDIMWQNEESVNNAKTLIKQVFDGKTIDLSVVEK